MTEKLVYDHPWQVKGLGQAPFRFLASFHYVSAASFGFNVEGYNRAMADAASTARHYGVHGGICEVCGMSLMNNYIVESADKKRFVVGCDCVNKAGNSELITVIERVEANRRAFRARTAEPESMD